ncbi:MAG: universal stress protein [Candidatus Desulfofervidaceae bacterium]|nr:universal stress protein [Candidatus Desulfofervidaceae bacterium]
MLTKILFPTDFSPQAEKLLEALPIFQKVGTDEVVLVHVVSSVIALDWPELNPNFLVDLQKSASNALDTRAEKLKASGFKVKTRVELGNPFKEILRVAEEEEVKLIIMGAHGKGFVSGLVLGSVTNNVLKYSKIPVLVYKLKVIEAFDKFAFQFVNERLFKKILFPTDWSPCAMSAIQYILQLKPGGVQEIVVCRIVDEDKVKNVSEEKLAKILRENEENLVQLKNDLEAHGLKIKPILKVGKPALEIAQIAEEEDVSLITMGYHGKGFFKGMLLGSVSTKVLELSKQPILFVRGK